VRVGGRVVTPDGIVDGAVADDQLQLVVFAVGVGELARGGGGLGLGLVKGGGRPVHRVRAGA